MKKQDSAQRILEQLGVKIEKSQWGLVGKIYDLENQGFQVELIAPYPYEKIEKHKKIHPGCTIFFKIMSYEFEKDPGYNFEAISSCLKKARITNLERISSSDGAISGAWFFEKQRVCGYFLGDDIPF